ncbi:MAG: TonB-dependent receptor [Bacteroidetes bacterium]|nr:TonB-dependent receptor [Bacteroidota bacterium]
MTKLFVAIIFMFGFNAIFAQTDSVKGLPNKKPSLDTFSSPNFYQYLKEVIVSGKSPASFNKIDKQSYKSAQFESAKGGSAIDVLKNLPSVTINGQGDIAIRGSTGFLVLINGKAILTDAQTVLSQLPANTIDNIELITAPSAKYDADGKAGIINIITKKGTNDGMGLVLNMQDGLPSTTNYHNLENPIRFGGDITLNVKQKKWDISIGTNFLRNDVNGRRDGDVFTKNFLNNTITRFPSSGERSFDKYNYAARATISYAASANDIITVGFFAGKKFQARRADILYNNSTSNLNTNALIRQYTYFNSNVQTKEGNFDLGNIDYTHTFKNKSFITATALVEHAKLYGNTINKNLDYPAKTNTLQEVYNPYVNPIDGYRFKLDYTTQIGSGKLESGYQFKHDIQDGQFDYFVTPATVQLDAARFKGSAKATNQINSFYSQYSGKQNKLQYVAGLRYEYATRVVNLSHEQNAHNLNLSNLFPSANLLYTVNGFWNVKAGYSKRVQRNNNFELNPIPEREHSETLEQGDPNLLPQFVDLVELGLNHNFSIGNFFSTIYFQNIKNPLQRVNSVYADTILNRLFTNAERARLVGIEFGTNVKLAKWCTVYLGDNLYQYTIDGGLNVLGTQSIVDNNGWVYAINSNASADLGKKWLLQANVNYTSKKPTAQGEDSRFLVPNTSLKKSFKDGRYAISLQWQNMNMGFMNSNQQRITTFGKDFYTTTNYTYETDVFLINFSFNLNKLSSKNKLPISEIGEKEF